MWVGTPWFYMFSLKVTIYTEITPRNVQVFTGSDLLDDKFIEVFSFFFLN